MKKVIKICSYRCVLFLWIVLYGALGSVHAEAVRDSLLLSTDFMYRSGSQGLAQDFYYSTAHDVRGLFTIRFYYIDSSGDSTLLLRSVSSKDLLWPSSGHVLHYDYGRQSAQLYVDPDWSSALRHSGVVPCGSYVYTFSLISAGDTLVHSYLLKRSDSLLPDQSPLRQDILETLEEGSSSSSRVQDMAHQVSNRVGNVVMGNRSKIDRYLRRKQLSARYVYSGSTVTIHIYSGNWSIGMLSMAQDASFSGLYAREQSRIRSGVADFGHQQLDQMQSLQSAFRELLAQDQSQRTLSGDVSVMGSWANQQEPNSGQDNQYYEVRGQLSFPVLEIPVTLSGYYTTQDRSRSAKASNFRFSYDAQKAKEQLLRLIGSYNQKYEQSLSQGVSYDMVYGQFVQGLRKEKDHLLSELQQECGIADFDPSHYNKAYFTSAADAALRRIAAKAADSLRSLGQASVDSSDLVDKARSLQAEAMAQYARAQSYYQKVQELERKISRYEQLVQQYRQSLHYDSLLSYSRLQDLRDYDQLSYKDMVRKASGLLPESKAKSFLSGLTRFDAGIFPQYVSRYTQSGQMLKGLDGGYDIGFAEIGGSYGNTEYADRTGAVIRYKSYSLRVQSKPISGQQLGLVYYGYSPSRSWLAQDTFFKGADLSLPSFRNPVSIVSATYNGTLAGSISLSGEYAYSNQQRNGSSQYTDQSRPDQPFLSRSAYQVQGEGSLLQQQVLIRGSYEYAGKDFENSTLPLLLSGTERLDLSGEGSLFRSFLRLKLSYTYMLQQHFSTTGKNARWGFGISTHSKRYPSVSLSYKPFSSFRTFSDTLAVAQKPVLGSVWTGKASYQLRKRSYALRFTLVYSRNESLTDSLNYQSSMIQLNSLYTHGKQSLMLSVGRSVLQSVSLNIPYPDWNNSSYLSLSGSQQLATGLSLGLSTDWGLSALGLSRYGWGCNSFYQLSRVPLGLRLTFRNSNYRLSEQTGWQHQYGGSLELSWRINTRL